LFAPAGIPAGREWIGRIPALIDHLCERWSLELDGDRIFNGYNAVVVLVRRNVEQLALKLTFPASGMEDEARALEVWNGHGMVRIVDVDLGVGAMLLERLDPARTLLAVSALEAAAVAGGLLRRLAIPALPGFRSLRALVGEAGRSLASLQKRLGNPVPDAWLRLAVELSVYLESHARTDLLVHTDLHYDNILAGTREPWLAIDPRAAAGEPEAMVPELLWTRDDYMESDASIRQMLAAIVGAGGLDLEQARRWVIVRCVDYFLWGLDHGLTEDPVRCRRILRAILR
jgi:streptomycin 6-kinase